MKSTNYQNTFISVADDCSKNKGTVPPAKNPETMAQMEYKLISNTPYKFTSDEVLFKIHCKRNGETTIQDFFRKNHAGMQCSPLTQSYGWGMHFDHESKIAIYGVETKEYAKLKADTKLKQRIAYVSKR